MEACDTDCSSFLQPRDQRVPMPDAKPAEIEDLKVAPAPGAQSGDALQGVEIVVKGRTHENSDLEVIAAVRLLPIVKTVNELLES